MYPVNVEPSVVLNYVSVESSVVLDALGLAVELSM
jgi:hypothetical protein